jgi:hypothetical protein
MTMQSSVNPQLSFSLLTVDLNSIEEADIPHCTIATLGKSEKITLIQVYPPKKLG